MTRQLDYTDAAVEDLKAVRRWLTQPGSGLRARQQLRAIRAAVNRLKQRPCLYPIGPHPSMREMPCDGGYRVLYVDTISFETRSGSLFRWWQGRG